MQRNSTIHISEYAGLILHSFLAAEPSWQCLRHVHHAVDSKRATTCFAKGGSSHLSLLELPKPLMEQPGTAAITSTGQQQLPSGRPCLHMLLPKWLQTTMPNVHVKPLSCVLLTYMYGQVFARRT